MKNFSALTTPSIYTLQQCFGGDLSFSASCGAQFFVGSSWFTQAQFKLGFALSKFRAQWRVLLIALLIFILVMLNPSIFD